MYVLFTNDKKYIINYNPKTNKSCELIKNII